MGLRFSNAVQIKLICFGNQLYGARIQRGLLEVIFDLGLSKI